MNSDLIIEIIISIIGIIFIYIKCFFKIFNYTFKKRLPKHPLDISLHNSVPRNIDCI